MCSQINLMLCNIIIAEKKCWRCLLWSIRSKQKPKLQSLFNKLSENIYFIGVAFDGLHTISLETKTSIFLLWYLNSSALYNTARLRVMQKPSTGSRAGLVPTRYRGEQTGTLEAKNVLHKNIRHLQLQSGNMCRFWQIFVEELDEFPNYFVQSKTSASAHAYSERNRA